MEAQTNFSKLPPQQQTIISGIKDWLYSHGALFDSLQIVYFHQGYRGAVSTRPIQKKERIVFIPRSQLITLEMARLHPICQQVLHKKVDLFSPKHTFLAVFLLEEMSKGESSYWKLYLDILPKNHSNFPINYANEEYIQLIGSSFLLQIHEKVYDLKRDYDRVFACCESFRKYKFKDFCWARTMVGSRMFGLHIDGVKTDILAPFADMLNHKLPKETSWNYIQAEQGFAIESLVDLPAGVEICDSYGKKCNSRYLLNYGFLLEDNPENQICLKVELDGQFRGKKLQMIRKKEGLKILRISKCMDDNNFYESIGFLRFKNIEDYNQLAVLEKISGIKITNEAYLPAKTPPLTMQVEMAVWGDLKAICERSLKQYPTTQQEDTLKLHSLKLSQNLRNIIILRLGEKRLFKNYIAICSEIIEVLKRGYVETFQHIAENQERPWCRYVFKILSIMPHEKKKETPIISFAPIQQIQAQHSEEELSED